MKVSAILALAAAVPSALAHGWVNYPPTRGEIKYGNDNERGFPLSAGKPSCTTLPKRSPPTQLSPGPLKITMQFNDGANHVGMCTVFIADSTGKNMKKIGEMQDCARSLHKGPGNKGDAPIKAEMTVNVPAGGCGGAQQCMLFWTLAATHISTTNPEIYDDCMDVTISGATSSSPSTPAKNGERCGPRFGNRKCATGLCCSPYSFCGTTSAHCVAGCQSGFGTCKSGPVVGNGQRCGAKHGNARCGSGLCCSIYGYCGNTNAHCAASQCQRLFGKCN